MPIYANELTMEALMREFGYAFAQKRYPGVPNLQVHPITLEPFTIGDIFITPILVWHLQDAGVWIPLWKLYLHHRCQPH
jgi:phosphoribosyl 1,2-cyclic phosphate phosphodiesterase